MSNPTKKTAAIPKIVATKKQFAELNGWSPGYVTKLAKQQRLVMDGNMVDVEESKVLIEQTAGGRTDVGIRHEEHRAKKVASYKNVAKLNKSKKATPDTESNKVQNEKSSNNRDEVIPIDKEEVQAAHRRKVLADMRRAESLAEKENLELLKLAGKLIEVEHADLAMRMVGATIRSLMDVFPSQVAPLVAPTSTIEECKNILSEQCRNVLLELTETLNREKQKLERPDA